MEIKDIERDTIFEVLIEGLKCGFCTDNNNRLIINCDWELVDEAGIIVDQQIPIISRNRFNLWLLCGRTISQVIINEGCTTDAHIEIDNGMTLKLINYNSETLMDTD